MAKLLDGQPDQAIIRAAERFASGDVPNQSKTFAPATPEFIAEVRNQAEYLSLRDRPRLPAPNPHYSGGMPPFLVTRQRLLAENFDREVLFDDISFDQFKKLSAARDIPVGASWVAALGIICGPRPKQSRQAA